MCSVVKLSFMISQSPFQQGLRLAIPAVCILQKRNITKHWDPKWRHLRAKKWLKVDLPDFDDLRRENQLTPDEVRSRMKKQGIAPPRPWVEKPICLNCTGDVVEPFVPPEGDGKASLISKSGAQQRYDILKKKGGSYFAVRKIRTFEDEFDLPKVAEEVQGIFIQANEALTRKDEERLHDLVTEKCFPEMMMNVNRKTLRWKFVKSLDIPRIVQVRCTELITKENVFAQVTLRMHSQQTLAVYDRFGRLMYGSEEIVKDVLEYVVFEKHLANMYGTWRVHGKIIPSWMPPKDPIPKTYREKEEEPVVEETVVPTLPGTTEGQPAVVT